MKNRIAVKILLITILSVCLAVMVGGFTAFAQNGKTKVEKPVLEVEFTYDGNTKTVTVPDTEYYKATPVTMANAGTYYVTVALIDKNNCEWSDGTTADLELPFTIHKAVFDESTLIYEDQAFLYNGKEHYIRIKNLPDNAQVLFSTVKTEPGVYPSKAIVDLGDNYVNREITLTGAVMTIKATRFKGANVTAVVKNGVDPSASFNQSKQGISKGDLNKLPSKKIAAYYAPKFNAADGEQITDLGEITYTVTVPSRYSGLSVYLFSEGEVYKADCTIEGLFVTFTAKNTDAFAVTYTSDSGEPIKNDLLWLEIILGLVVVAEIAYIAYRVIKLKKM